MAKIRSGVSQKLHIREPGTPAGAYTELTGEASGFTGLSQAEAASTYEVVSAGTRRTGDAGNSALSLTFTVAETDESAPWLLGQSGRRAGLRWRPEGDKAGRAQFECEAILAIAYAGAANGICTLAVTATVDGDLVASVIP